MCGSSELIYVPGSSHPISSMENYETRSRSSSRDLITPNTPTVPPRSRGCSPTAPRRSRVYSPTAPPRSRGASRVNSRATSPTAKESSPTAPPRTRSPQVARARSCSTPPTPSRTKTPEPKISFCYTHDPRVTPARKISTISQKSNFSEGRRSPFPDLRLEIEPPNTMTRKKKETPSTIPRKKSRKTVPQPNCDVPIIEAPEEPKTFPRTKKPKLENSQNENGNQDYATPSPPYSLPRKKKAMMKEKEEGCYINVPELAYSSQEDEALPSRIEHFLEEKPKFDIGLPPISPRGPRKKKRSMPYPAELKNENAQKQLETKETPHTPLTSNTIIPKVEISHFSQSQTSINQTKPITPPPRRYATIPRKPIRNSKILEDSLEPFPTVSKQE